MTSQSTDAVQQSPQKETVGHALASVLSQLAEKCERAGEGGLSLDKEILAAFGYSWRGMDYWHHDNKRMWKGPTRFTSSLDSALTLVPKSHCYQIKRGIGCESIVWSLMGDYDDDGAPAGHHMDSPALALCAAALRARATLSTDANACPTEGFLRSSLPQSSSKGGA